MAVVWPAPFISPCSRPPQPFPPNPNSTRNPSNTIIPLLCLLSTVPHDKVPTYQFLAKNGVPSVMEKLKTPNSVYIRPLCPSSILDSIFLTTATTASSSVTALLLTLKS